MWDWIKTYSLYPLPHHLLSRLVLWATRQESRATPAAIRWFARKFDVDMKDAVEEELGSYTSFNRFFTRALKPEARPIDQQANSICSPADGRISAIGEITDGRIYQAKGRDYSLDVLIGGDQSATQRLANGGFTTIYLSPRDYHRLHMPVAGTLLSQTHIPGRLFSVGPHTVRALPNLFARNERVIAQFETEAGLMALVLVGAINVAAIETVWHGLVTPPQRRSMSTVNYPDEQAVNLAKGDEMGRFNMGSTIIVLMENPVAWRVDMQPGDAVRMGQFLGNLPAPTKN